MNTKQRACNSIINSGFCKFETNCKYAHSSNELCISKCNMNEKCKKVMKTSKIADDGEWKNQKNIETPCFYLHPYETNENYCKRLNIKLPKTTLKTQYISPQHSQHSNHSQQDSPSINSMHSFPTIQSSPSVKSINSTPPKYIQNFETQVLTGTFDHVSKQLYNLLNDKNCKKVQISFQ